MMRIDICQLFAAGAVDQLDAKSGDLPACVAPRPADDQTRKIPVELQVADVYTAGAILDAKHRLIGSADISPAIIGQRMICRLAGRGIEGAKAKPLRAANPRAVAENRETFCAAIKVHDLCSGEVIASLRRIR